MVNAMTLFLIFATLAFTIVFGDSYPTIKTDNGQIFKCVNFYDQPTFRDPSRKHEVVPNLSKLQQQEIPIGFGFEGIKCPIGTVPILESPKKLKLDESTLPEDNTDPADKEYKHCIAKAQTPVVEDPTKGFYGANACIGIYKPDNVQIFQWSSAFMRLSHGDQSVEAGWMVEPARFRDNEAHLYSFYSVKGKGCINLECYGFVQVSSQMPLGVAADRYSIVGGLQAYWNLSIDKNLQDGRWWLSVTATKHKIGYWSFDLFKTDELLKSMNMAATQVEFGGQVGGIVALNRPISMGNGYQAAIDPQRSAGIYQINLIYDDQHRIRPPYLSGYSNCNDIYTVLDGFNKNNENSILYGGPKDPHH